MSAAALTRRAALSGAVASIAAVATAAAVAMPIGAGGPAAVSPLRRLLAERNAIVARLNGPGDWDDATGAAFCAQIAKLERELFGREAQTPDDAIVKLVAAAQVLAEGHELDEEEAAHAIRAAAKHFGIGYVYPHLGGAA